MRRAFVVLGLCSGAARAFAPSLLASPRSLHRRYATVEKTSPGPTDPRTGKAMRPPLVTSWKEIRKDVKSAFSLSEPVMKVYDDVSKDDLMKGYEMMQVCRQFENACNQVRARAAATFAGEGGPRAQRLLPGDGTRQSSSAAPATLCVPEPTRGWGL